MQPYLNCEMTMSRHSFWNEASFWQWPTSSCAQAQIRKVSHEAGKIIMELLPQLLNCTWSWDHLRRYLPGKNRRLFEETYPSLICLLSPLMSPQLQSVDDTVGSFCHVDTGTCCWGRVIHVHLHCPHTDGRQHQTADALLWPHLGNISNPGLPHHLHLQSTKQCAIKGAFNSSFIFNNWQRRKGKTLMC